MRGTQTITPESFEALLSWLAPSREAAGQKYETIRVRLIKIFINRGCADAEDLADLVINRVIMRLPEIRDNYVGDPANYFCGVAHKVYLESRRRKEIATDFLPNPIASPPEPEEDAAQKCLQECLQALPPDQRNLVLEYYLDEKQAKIEHRKRLADLLGLTANALRLRAHRIRASLEACVLRCLDGSPT